MLQGQVMRWKARTSIKCRQSRDSYLLLCLRASKREDCPSVRPAHFDIRDGLRDVGGDVMFGTNCF